MAGGATCHEEGGSERVLVADWLYGSLAFSKPVRLAGFADLLGQRSLNSVAHLCSVGYYLCARTKIHAVFDPSPEPSDPDPIANRGQCIANSCSGAGPGFIRKPNSLSEKADRGLRPVALPT